MIDRQTSIALLREELEQQRTRAEAAEAELRELRKLVDAWKVADLALHNSAEMGTPADAHRHYQAFHEAEEALRHA